MSTSPALEGLSTEEAAARLRRVGVNEPAPPPRSAALRELARGLANPLVLVLVLASVLAAAFGQFISAAVTALILALSVALNVVQGYRSTQAARRLRERAAPTATVVRAGRVRSVPAREVVPGDVLRLAAGDLVPADARLLEAKDLFLDEAALTGESLPREKAVGSAEGVVRRGTSVVSGVGTAVVTATGPATQFGQVVAQLAARPPETEFERGSRRFGMLILKVVLVLVLFVFLVNTLLRRDPLESFLFAVALAVGLTPELLPMIVSVTLAAGAVRMARRRVIVKRLAAIEDLGSMDILCCDKTGTLTAGAITVVRHVDVRGEENERVIRLAALNSAFQTGLASPMDEAILRHQPPAVGDHVRVDEVPFDFSRRRLSIVVDGPEGRRLITKGAPESVLPLCDTVALDGLAVPLDEATSARARTLFETLSREGFRVLAVAERPVEPQPAYGIGDERALTLAGFAAFLDPPRDDVDETLAALRADGVTVKILTGDNELVTRRVCALVGFEGTSIVLGRALDDMSDPALAAVAERTDVFARVSPAQKTRIVQALRARGHVVGVLGDGINDAAALRAADVGVSVDTAVDVARDAADILLLEKGLGVLHDGIVEGRRSFGNIMKYVLMSTSSSFGNMLSMAAASLVLPFLPLLPLQILLNNLLYDLAQVAIPSDRVDGPWQQAPRRWNAAFIRRYMLTVGPISSIFDLATFAVMLLVFQAEAPLFRTGWFVESLATQTLVIFVIRTSGSPWTLPPSRGLTLGVAVALGVGLALPFTPLAPWLGFVPLPPLFLAFLLGVTALYLGAMELAKRRLHAGVGV